MPKPGQSIHRYDAMSYGKKCRRCGMKVTTKAGKTLYDGSESATVPTCNPKPRK